MPSLTLRGIRFIDRYPYMAIALVCLAIVAGITFDVWLLGSILASTTKAISNDCGHTYPVEGIFIRGNWFCPSSP